MTAHDLPGWPFHTGELAAQERAGGGARGHGIRDRMSDQHRAFFAGLPFVVVATSDGNWPIATVWTGPVGFVEAPDPSTLQLAVTLDPADPASHAFSPGAALGLLGIDLATRRRNRANGVIRAVGDDDITVAVRQSFGNCPQYIWPRELRRAYAAATPTEHFDQLDDDASAAIGRTDTLFVASSANVGEPTGGVDVSHRGGPRGFVGVDRNVLTIPDYAGNRYFNTLGNLVANPHAALLIIDFERGDILHLQGTAEIDWHRAAGADGDRKHRIGDLEPERLWRLRLTHGWRRRGVLGLRWSPPLGRPIRAA